MRITLKLLSTIALTVGAVLCFARGSLLACQNYDEYGLSVCVNLESSAYIRLPNVKRTLFNPTTETFFTRHADNLEFQRNALHIVLDGSPHAISEALGFPVRWHLELQPFYDSTYDFTGSGQGMYSVLGDQLRTNINGRLADSYDPLFREYYLDLLPRNFFIRLGRQIIPWGKSDGIYMLDILNNFNLVNPENFNEQVVKIPVWAANITWNATTTGSLQAVFIPQYFPTYYAGIQYKGGFPVQGGFGDFTYNSVAFANNILNGEFGVKFPTMVNQPSTRLNNWTYATRWSDQIGNVHYTLNYAYTWTSTMISYPNTGNNLTAGAFNLHPHRIHVAGGSADYDVDVGNEWVDGTVFRAESAVTTQDVYYEGTVGNPIDVTHWGALFGVDRIVLKDYLDKPIFLSFQYWQDWVLRRNNHCTNCGPFSNKFQDVGFYGGPSGMRGLYKSLSTLYMDKTWMTGDILDTYLSVVYDWQYSDWWIQPQTTYRVTDYTTVGMGFNIFAGSKQSPYGEFTNNTNVFFFLRKTLL